MTYTIALVLFVLLVVLAFVIEPATILLCLAAAFLLVVYVAPAVPWLAIAAGAWLLLQFIAGLKSAASAARRAPPA